MYWSYVKLFCQYIGHSENNFQSLRNEFEKWKSKLSKRILKDAKVDANKRAGQLDNDELNRIREQLDKYTIEGDLRREVNMNIKLQMEINSYRGTRHKKGLPVRGQRTNRNARTRKGKGKTVANKKK